MAEPRAYVTYFDQRYLAFALVTLRSIRQHDPQAEIFPLCFDNVAYDAIVGLGDKKITAISAEEIWAFEPGLKDRQRRVRQAFYSTHKPVLPIYVFHLRPNVAAVAHIDADVYFYSSPQPLFDEIGAAPIAVSPHRFAPEWKSSEVFGRFNAGFIYWRNDPEAHKCLREYRKDVFAWCEPAPQPDGRFMNQGYLTAWPQRYSGVHIIEHPGVNLSWWNVAAHTLRKGPVVTVDDRPLIFYHFSYVNLDALGIWHTLRKFGDNDRLTVRDIYRPYLKEIERTDRELRSRIPDLLPIERLATPAATTPVRRGPWPRTQEGWIARAKWELGLRA